MTCNINTPKYPVISWQTYWTDSVANEIEVGCDGNFDTFLISDAAWQGLWGFENNASNIAQASSLHGYLASLIQNFLRVDCGFGLAECTARYYWDLPGHPRVQFTVANVSSNDVTIEFFYDTVAYHFGVNGASLITIDGASGLGYTDFNGAGYWAPNNLTCYDDRISISPTSFSVESLAGTSWKTVTWTEPLQDRSLTFPFVRPPYLWSFRRKDTAWATPAGLNVNDPNNLYENFLNAARQNNSNQDATPFRIYSDDGVYRGARAINVDQLRDPRSNLTDQTNGSFTYFNIAVFFRDVDGEGTGV